MPKAVSVAGGVMGTMDKGIEPKMQTTRTETCERVAKEHKSRT